MQGRPAIEAIDAKAGLPAAPSFLSDAEQNRRRAIRAAGVVARIDQDPCRGGRDAVGVAGGDGDFTVWFRRRGARRDDPEKQRRGGGNNLLMTLHGCTIEGWRRSLPTELGAATKGLAAA